MRLYGEIMAKTGLSELFEGGRCTLLFGGGGYFQGVKAVREFTPEKLVLDFKKGELELLGTGFSIAKYCDGDLSVFGEISSFHFVKKDKTGEKTGV